MPTLNLLAELYHASEELDRAQQVIDRKRTTFFGRRRRGQSTLMHAQTLLDAERIRVDAAIEYLHTVEEREK